MEEIVVYVHGKGGSAQEAEHYKALFPDCEVIGFDYHAQSPWEATEEFLSLIHISEPTRRTPISYAVFCLKKKKFCLKKNKTIQHR